jgi:hypothetical protein
MKTMKSSFETFVFTKSVIVVCVVMICSSTAIIVSNQMMIKECHTTSQDLVRTGQLFKDDIAELRKSKVK